MRPCECDELAIHNPVKVSIFDLDEVRAGARISGSVSHLFVVFILGDVKCFKVEESVHFGLLHATDAVKHREIECTFDRSRIMEGFEGRADASKWCIRLVCR